MNGPLYRRQITLVLCDYPLKSVQVIANSVPCTSGGYRDKPREFTGYATANADGSFRVAITTDAGSLPIGKFDGLATAVHAMECWHGDTPYMGKTHEYQIINQ